MMKKLFCFILTLMLVFVVSGCSQSGNEPGKPTETPEMPQEDNLNENTSTPMPVTTENIEDTSTLNAVDLIGMQVSDMVNLLASDYTYGSYTGGNYVYFPDLSLQAYTNRQLDEYYPDAIVRFLVCGDDFPVIDNKPAGMTYSELIASFPEAANKEVSLGAPGMEDWYQASVDFEYGEYIIRCEWTADNDYPDIYSNKCKTYIANKSTGFTSVS